MNEERLFQQMSFVRNRTLALIETATEDMADRQPEGYSNNIRWNLGHIYVNEEKLIHRLTRDSPLFPDSYIELFNAGTHPGEWKANTPTLPQLYGNLKEQRERNNETYKERLQVSWDESFHLHGMVFKTLEQVMTLSLWHEGVHQGTIMSLLKAQGVNMG